MSLAKIITSILGEIELKPISSLEKAINGPQWMQCKYGKELIAYLKSNLEYEKFDNHMQYLGSSGSNIKIESLADWLVERANDVGVSEAIKELNTYNSSREVTVYGIMLLSGIYVENEYTFCNNVRLVNERGIPNKKLTMDIYHNLMNSILPLPRIQSVFLLPFTQKVHHIKQDNIDKENYFTNMPIESLEETKLCLILARNLSGVHSISHGTMSPDNLPYIQSFSGWSLSSTKLPTFSQSVLEIELNHANLLLKKYIGIDPIFKNKLKVSIETFNSYCSLSTQVERAISLRTCLESIFLDDGNKEQLRYRLGLRGALFLGNSLEEKKNIMKILKDTYDITSSAVHEGKISDKQMKKINVLNESAKLAKEAIIKLINEGKINWEDLELK